MVSDLTFNPKSSVLDELGMRLKDLSHKIAPHLPTPTVKENLLCPGKIKKKAFSSVWFVCSRLQ